MIQADLCAILQSGTAMSQPIDEKPSKQRKDPREPLENQPVEWQNEDIVNEGRKPNLEEIEEDTAAL